MLANLESNTLFVSFAHKLIARKTLAHKLIARKTLAHKLHPNTCTPNTRTYEHLFDYTRAPPSPIFGSKVDVLIFRIEVSRNRTKKRAAQWMQRREKIKLNFYFLIPPFFLGVRKTSPYWYVNVYLVYLIRFDAFVRQRNRCLYYGIVICFFIAIK